MASAFKNTTINDTGQLTLPVGTSAQRPKYKIETFSSNTTWTCPTDVREIDVLVIAGGGAGGSAYGGGGGAGGLVYRSGFTVTPGTPYTVTVGAGGTSVTGTIGANGQNSVFGSLTATGGGGGGFHGGANDLRCNGYPGGSGGGGSIGGSGGAPATGTGGAGTEGQGYEGGTGYHNAFGSQYPTGGGGGAGGRGADGSSPKCGVGGPGLPFGITETPTFYAGGGGGASGGAATAATGGIGGGGTGSNASGGSNGTAGTGGGGGGAGSGGNGSGAGGTGIVIIRYLAEREFTSDTTWTVPTGVSAVEVLVVGGGGGGGWAGGGGGGGGGVLYRPNFGVTPGDTFTVTVGAGGAGATSNTGPGTNGGDSHFRAVSNLITNGIFTNDVSGWTVADANEGSFVWSSGRAVLTNTSETDPPVNAYQAVSLIVGRTYTVSATKVAGSDFVVNLMALPGPGGGSGGIGNVLYWPDTQYGRQSATFVATDATMYVVLRINRNTNGATVTLDDVELYETDKAIVAIGGGGGGTHQASGLGQQGAAGGSGGGASMNYSGNTFAGGGSAKGQGFNGGSSLETSDNPRITSGGGGAGGPSANTRSAVFLASMPNGGPGLPSNISGVLKYYGGGGGGGDTLLDRTGPGPGAGGIGGGGNGSRYSASGSVDATAGKANTGGGGGGGSNEISGTVKNGAAGGSGIVIVRYNPDTTSSTFDNTFTTNKIRFNTTVNKFDVPRLNSSPRSDVEYPVTDGLSLLLDAGSQKSYPKLNIIQVKCWTVTTAVRSANYTVQYSDDGTNWTTAFGGVMSATGTPGMITGTVTSGGSGTTGTGAWGRRRNWRYVEGSTVNGHHPRVSRIMLIDNEGTEHELIHYCGDNISDVGGYVIGTVSTSVLGKTWYDLSGNNRHFHLNRMVSTNPEANTTSPAQSFFEAGPQSYFNINSNVILAYALSPATQIPFLGPPSDQMGFTQEHTIQAVVYIPSATINFLYHFSVHARDISPENAAGPNGADGSIRFASHLYYGGNSFYYDYPGCCDSQNRVDFGNGAGSGTAGGGVTGAVSMDASWAGNIKLATYRCRRTDFPRKQFFRNQTVEYSSLQREVGYAINNRSDPGHLGTTNTGGQRFFYFAMYDRALTDAELGANWTYLSNRFAIS